MTDAPSRFVTLADLHREGAKLWMECQGCGHIGRLTAHSLVGGDGDFSRPDITTPEMEATTIETVKTKLRCKSCGSRDIFSTIECRTY